MSEPITLTREELRHEIAVAVGDSIESAINRLFPSADVEPEERANLTPKGQAAVRGIVPGAFIRCGFPLHKRLQVVDVATNGRISARTPDGHSVRVWHAVCTFIEAGPVEDVVIAPTSTNVVPLRTPPPVKVAAFSARLSMCPSCGTHHVEGIACPVRSVSEPGCDSERPGLFGAFGDMLSDCAELLTGEPVDDDDTYPTPCPTCGNAHDVGGPCGPAFGGEFNR